jgi:hypothetical protein
MQKDYIMTKEIDHAQRDLANLEDQREVLFSRAKLLSKKREQVAFAALTGDKAAKAELRDINLEDVNAAGNIASVEAALVVARNNLASAKAAAAGAADHQKARQIAELNTKLKEVLDDADDAFADAIASTLSARGLLMEMHALGVAAPSDQQYRINAVAAIKTAIQLLPSPYISDFEFARLAPSQKKTFKDLAAAWTAQIANHVTARLGEKQTDHKEVA